MYCCIIELDDIVQLVALISIGWQYMLRVEDGSYLLEPLQCHNFHCLCIDSINIYRISMGKVMIISLLKYSWHPPIPSSILIFGTVSKYGSFLQLNIHPLRTHKTVSFQIHLQLCIFIRIGRHIGRIPCPSHHILQDIHNNWKWICNTPLQTWSWSILHIARWC